MSMRGKGGHAAAPRQVRIIGGQWKRTPLAVIDAEGLRPTPDRVRETVFNWLHHLLDGQWEGRRCLDLFAGTGAFGFEAASRGADQVVLVENNSSAIRQLEAAKARLRAGQVRIQRGDALAAAQALAARGERFDLIFLDPPYHQEWLVKILPLCERLTGAGGLVYAESETALESESTPDWVASWEVIRAGHAGMVFYHLLQRKSESGFEA
jgi:16S rRNA (guanine(966)-N(2))-methyltransferase RsmD